MWIKDWFGSKRQGAPKPQAGRHCVAQLNMRMMPVDRGAVFEDPLDEFLRLRKLGEVTGGGTRMAPGPEGIASCDVEIRLDGDEATAKDQVIEMLESLGAPKGSVLRSVGLPEIGFGKAEGLGLFLNGTDLAAEVYATSDINAVVVGCAKALADNGILRGSWRGSRETALYFYGPSYQIMQAALADYAATVPLCERARFAQIA